MDDRTIYITEIDRDRLLELIRDAGATGYRGSEYLKKLRGELDRARVVAPAEVPADVVTMHSQVFMTDVGTGEEMTYTLVYPPEADLDAGKLSILAPVGTALLGYRTGDVIEWPVPTGMRRIKIEKILFQPESSGRFDL